MTGILEELKWETLQKRRKDNRLILLYKGLKVIGRIPTDDHLSNISADIEFEIRLFLMTVFVIVKLRGYIESRRVLIV